MVTKLEASPSQWLHLVASSISGVIWSQTCFNPPVGPSNNNNDSLYLVINVAVLVLVTLRRHVLCLALVGPSFLAVVQIGAVGVQRRLQVGQQGICKNQNEESS